MQVSSCRIFRLDFQFSCLSSFKIYPILFLMLVGWRQCVQNQDIPSAHPVIPHRVRSLCPCLKFKLPCSLLFISSKPLIRWSLLCIAEWMVRDSGSNIPASFQDFSEIVSIRPIGSKFDFLVPILFVLSKQCLTFYANYFSEWSLRIQASFSRKLRRTKLENIFRMVKINNLQPDVDE